MAKKGSGSYNSGVKRGGGHRGRGGQSHNSRRVRAFEDDFGRPESAIDDVDISVLTLESQEDVQNSRDKGKGKEAIPVPVAMWVCVIALIPCVFV